MRHPCAAPSQLGDPPARVSHRARRRQSRTRGLLFPKKMKAAEAALMLYYYVMRKLWNTVFAMGRPFLLAVAGLLVVVVLFVYKLDTLTPGVSQAEVDTYNSTRSLGMILDNGVDAPYRSAVFLSTKAINNLFGLRLVGAALGVLTVVIFYLIAKKLYVRSVALATTAMFAASSLLLTVTRLATPNVMLLSLLAIVAAGYLVRFHGRSGFAWILASAVIGLSLYVPGMIIFIAIGAIWQFAKSKRSFESLAPAIIIICPAILSLLAAPLIISLIREPQLWRDYIGLPSALQAPLEMIKDIARAAASLFIMSPKNPVIWLGRQPVLDVFSTVLFLFGCWTLVKRRKLDRFWTILGIFAITFLLTGLTGNLLFIVLLLPFLFITTGFGLQELLDQWYRVFPRNPIARYAGLCLVIIAVLLSINFQLRRYFVAWPNSQDTKQAFQQKLTR